MRAVVLPGPVAAKDLMSRGPLPDPPAGWIRIKVDHPLVDDGDGAAQVREICPPG
ncbi:hypothetical protein Kfla_0190 [Kribbella flavida DSM 17836]|uniref:Uncharacterized protein n=1 Tax=Kribbella flavida (strain DSM 17836 / JCM 10339 / NBRC 14399) TaxID=479435 RepID=D2PRY8_KRIFD|nr:hypothetical protein [Kribbella flavida]ADB29318.1 hypothetical protein Kfla_0190 [Kribbella flavida DSM 17836]